MKPGLYPERDCCRCASIPRLIHRELIASDWSLGLGIPGCAHSLVACAIIFLQGAVFFFGIYLVLCNSSISIYLRCTLGDNLSLADESIGILTSSGDVPAIIWCRPSPSSVSHKSITEQQIHDNVNRLHGSNIRVFTSSQYTFWRSFPLRRAEVRERFRIGA